MKVYQFPRTSQVEDAFKCSEAVASQALEYAFESAQECFWEDVQEVARDIFGPSVKVYSEGRSGGWLVVHGINENVEEWDAIYLAKWARLVKHCAADITDRSRWENVRDDIEANEWAGEWGRALQLPRTERRTHSHAIRTEGRTRSAEGSAVAMSLRDFIKANRSELDECIRRVCPGLSLNDNERRQWILNDEGLYRWARSEGVRI